MTDPRTRDPDRILRLLGQLERLWQLEPDLRLGQVLRNVVPSDRILRNDGSEQTLSLFEDEQWEQWIDAAIRRLGKG